MKRPKTWADSSEWDAWADYIEAELERAKDREQVQKNLTRIYKESAFDIKKQLREADEQYSKDANEKQKLRDLLEIILYTLETIQQERNDWHNAHDALKR